ncbi:MAG: pectinesterase family protein [Microbacterium gubbeenense]|uniref:pectinesterase family protein n=3 Tax=Microbacterium gubbeenense TaxID=159896 RepID=UPI00041412FA|nr:pectinesterase family protein [Microbacterium gubbeenense]
MPRVIEVGDDADLVPSLSLALADESATEILMHPGTYVEHVVVAPRQMPLLIRSTSGDPEDVVVSFELRQGDRDRTGMPYVQDCATFTIDSDHVTLRGITIENPFDKRVDPSLPDQQALALRTRGDRILIEACRLIGQQDTVLLDAPSWAALRRVHLRECLITGDVDFVYGRATALIEGGEIRSVGPGYVTAPSTAAENPRGFLFSGVRLTSEGLAPGSVHLGRPWHPGGKPDALGQALFVHCEIGAHIAAVAWTEMGGFDWQDARLAEFENTGPGAHATGPQLDEAPDARAWLEDPPPTGARRVIVVSDSTASPYPPERAPRAGWAEHLTEFTGLETINRAISGASTRSFIDEGWWDLALADLGAGDVLAIGFGHNDPKPDHRFADPFTRHPANLRRFVLAARARGAVPVLLTPVERRTFEDGRLRSSHGAYPQAVRHLAAEEHVDLIDLSAASQLWWQELGEERTRSRFMWVEPGTYPAYPAGERDDTHFSTAGARDVARLVADGLRSLGLAN